MTNPGFRPGVPVCIVGAGPCGLAAAIAVQAAGIPAIVFDRECVVSSVAGYPTFMTFFSTAERLEIGGLPFAYPGEKPARRDALAYYRSAVSHFGLTVRQYEPVERVECAGAGFVVHSRPRGGAPVATHARAVVVATGYFGHPNRIGVSGEDLPHVTHIYHEGHEAFQGDAVVVGGGNAAVDAALDLWRAGARVTLVHFGPTFDHVIKPWILPDFQGRVAEGVITVSWNTRVTGIEPWVVHLRTPAGARSIPARHVYLMTGFTPHPGLLSSLDVPIDPSSGVPDHDPATMETATPGVFIAGVLSAGYDANKVFIENGRRHGDLIARALVARG